MAYIRSSFAFALIWVNFIASSVNIYFSIAALKNLNGNYLYKPLRLSVLIINCGAFCFIFLLSVSFSLTKNECCKEDYCLRCENCFNHCCDGCCNYDSSRGGNNREDSGSGGAAGLIVLPIVIIIGIIIGLYYAIKSCGKHIARIVAIITLIAINVTLVVLSLCSRYDLNCILIAAFSSVAAICNFLGILLPNLYCCEILTYDYEPIYPSSPINQLNTNLFERIETPKKEETYYEKPHYEQNDPVPEESSLKVTNKPSTPDYIEDNQGIGIINGSSDTNDTPSEEYEQTNNNDNNPEDIPYPTTQ